MDTFKKLIENGIDINSADMRVFRTNQYDDLSGEWSAPIVTSWDDKTIHLHFPTAQIAPYWSNDRLLEICPKKININNETFYFDLYNDVNINTKTGAATCVYNLSFKNENKIFGAMHSDHLQTVLIEFLAYVLTMINLNKSNQPQ